MAVKGTFYVVHIRRLSTVSLEQVKEKMDKAVDWYRLGESLWIVYSTADIEMLYARYSSLVKEDGSLLIIKLDVEVRHGWMTKDFWEWLDKRNVDAGE